MKTEELKSNNYSLFLILWLGQFIAAIGSGMTYYGLTIYLYRKTGLTFPIGLIVLGAFLPTLLLSIPYGIISDRYNKRMLMILADLFSIPGLLIVLQGINLEKGIYIIVAGVVVSSIASSLSEPAFKATVSEILKKEEFSKASSLLGLNSAARYLVAPFIGAVLINFIRPEDLILIDMGTLLITIITTSFVKRELDKKKGLVIKVEKDLKEKIKEKVEEGEINVETQLSNFSSDFKKSLRLVFNNNRLIILTFLSSLVTLFLGTIQVLINPLILDFNSNEVLGLVQTISGSGIMVTGIILSAVPIKKGFYKKLLMSFFIMGLSMALLSFKQNIILIAVFGFTFFASMPLANTMMDYLFRTSLNQGDVGKVFGLVSVISQLGYLLAYVGIGFTADFITLKYGLTTGRGAAVLIFITGILMVITSIVGRLFNNVMLENNYNLVEKTVEKTVERVNIPN